MTRQPVFRVFLFSGTFLKGFFNCRLAISGFWILGSGFWILGWVLSLRLWARNASFYISVGRMELEVVMWGYRVGHVMGMI